MKNLIRSLALLAVLAPAASADGFGIRYSKKNKHESFSIGYSSGHARAPTYFRDCAPRRWIPGHMRTVYRQVWVEGCERRVWVGPRYENRCDRYGRSYPVCVSRGRYQIVLDQGHYETRPFEVWVEGHWQA